MKDTITKSMFLESFGGQYEKNFSYEGKVALFDYMEGLEQDLEQEFELDIIGLCCSYVEYADLKEFQDDYTKEYKSIEDIEDDATVIRFGDGSRFIVEEF